MGSSLAHIDQGPDVQGTILSLSSSSWNVVHNFVLNGKGVVTDVTVLLVPSGRARHADLVSVPRFDASYETRLECIVVGDFRVESGVHPSLNIVEAVVTSHNSLGVLDQLIAQA